MITEQKAEAITDMAKHFAKVWAISFVEWAYREGWRQQRLSTQWLKGWDDSNFFHTTEQVFEKYEEYVATLPPADVQLQSALS